MDLHHRTPFPGKTQVLKSRTDGKSSEAPKVSVKEPHINRGRRVFGTVRNQNAPTKPVTNEMPTKKPLCLVPKKPTKMPINATAVEETAAATPRKPSENSNVVARSKKKTVNFCEKVEENKDKILQEGDVSAGVQTPLRSPFLIKPNVVGTPYQSAERCSKCRFDKLETSSYWLGQIRLAESVGKHFVSSAFFRLAAECKAEPFRNIKVELKKYLGRHEYLSGEKEWKDLSVSYGLMKEESNVCHNSNEEETIEGLNNKEEETIEDSGHPRNTHDEQEKQIMEPVAGEPGNE